MKIKNDYIMREIAGEIVVVPVGQAAARFNGMITLNETGAFIWKFLQESHSEAELLEALLDEFEADSSEAESDIARFINVLRENDMLEA